jgi:glucosamine-6-phosphate deaminase
VPIGYTLQELRRWCSIPVDELENHPGLKVPLRLVADSAEMGEVMARELVDELAAHNRQGKPTHAIVPCGPMAWYEPFRRIVNADRVSLKNLHVYHMDECLDWQGRLLPAGHPYNFRATMQRVFSPAPRTSIGWPTRSPGCGSTLPWAGGARTGTWPTTRPAASPTAR